MSENLNKVYSQVQIVEAISATKVLDKYDTGKIFTFDTDATITVTLPAAEAGLVHEFHFGVTFTNTLIIQAASSGDTFQGAVQVIDKDEKGGLVALNEDVDTTAWTAPAAADYIMTFNADADGRFLGGYLKFVAINDSKWLLSGTLFGDGTVTHQFS